MSMKNLSKSLGIIGLGACLLSFSLCASAADENAAKSLARQSIYSGRYSEVWDEGWCF